MRRALGLAGAGTAAALAGLAGLARGEDVNITANTTTGVNLDTFAGTTARVFPGVTVTNTGTLISASFPAIFASTQAWTLNQDGTVNAPLGNGITFNAGGTVNNSGTIAPFSQGIHMGAAGTVNNLATGLIDAGSNGVLFTTTAVGTVVNAGIIRSGIEAVTLLSGGTLTNQATGLIEVTSTSNAVALLFGTSRTVVNDGIIRNTSPAGFFAAGISIAGGTVTNNSAGTIFGTYNAIWGNGSVALVVNNSGLLQSNEAAGATVEADAGGTITNSGRITNTGDAILFFAAGTVTNRGIIESTGTGLAINFSNNAANTLILDTGSVLTGNVQGGTGADALILQGTGTESIAKFLSFQTLSMQGTNWTLTGTGAFTTSAVIQSGILNVAGTLTTPVLTVQAAGTLMGTGTIVGSVVNAGIIAPGNSIGTLNVTGPVTFNAGSFYNVEVNAAGAGDRTVATGTGTLLGGTVRVFAAPGSYAPLTTYTILTANGGVTGTFAGVTSNFAFFQPTLTYDANNVYLTLALNGLQFQDVAQTPNQFAVARTLAPLGAGNPIWNALITLSAPGARAALDALSGEIHASLKTALFEDSRHFRETLAFRVRQAFAAATPADILLAQAPGSEPIAPGAAPPKRYGVWGTGFGALGSTDGDGNAGRLTRATSGFFAGADMPLGEHWTLGIATGWSHTSLQVDERDSSSGIDTVHLAAYGGAQYGPVGLRAGLAHAWHDVDTRRTIAFPGFSDNAAAGYRARSLQLFGEAGYAMRFGAVALEPYGSLAYVRLSTGNFAETGGPAALAGQSSRKSLLFSTLGLRAATTFTVRDATLVARGALGWRHAFGSVTPEADLAFAAGPFTVAGVPVARDAVVVEAGLDAKLTSRITLGLGYSGQIAGTADSHRISAKLTVRF